MLFVFFYFFVTKCWQENEILRALDLDLTLKESKRIQGPCHRDPDVVGLAQSISTCEARTI